MTLISPFLDAVRSALRMQAMPRRVSTRLAVSAATTALALTALTGIVPPTPPTPADQLAAYISAHAQSVTVSKGASVVVDQRDPYSTTAGAQSFVASGTNYDWAKLVLLSGGWPVSDANVTVMTRWMRQENGPNSWWNRNNPLNNGWGSGGGAGLGSYPNLVVAAQMVVAMLNGNPQMRPIVAGLAASAPTNVTEQAIWASPWASSHYGHGSYWHYTPVDVVKAPPSAW